MTAVARIAAPSPQGGADTAELQGDTKYRYPEFAGWVGERYLKKILRQILPMALYRTWEIFVEHQANGNECYLGVSQLAAIAGRTSRTMQSHAHCPGCAPGCQGATLRQLSSRALQPASWTTTEGV
jgi:hypothetical protein